MLNGVYDYRSDTVTQPTRDMLDAMTRAPLGDDGWGDDPTVHALQAKTAHLLGLEASLFVVSGTQANLLALMAHEVRGKEVLLDEVSHMYNGELGNISTVAGALPRPLSSTDGLLDLDMLVSRIRPQTGHFAGTGLISIENTHNRSGGRVWPLITLAEISDLARHQDVKIHMDGARVFNAAVALGVPVREIVRHVDSVSFCLSKGLGAPAGSMLVGSKSFVDRARTYRTMLGGTLRQTGVLAAAGIYALDQHVDRLEEDHRRAKKLAEGLAVVPGLYVEPTTVETNIIEVILPSAPGRPEKIVASLEQQRVRVAMRDRVTMRLVTHLHTTDSDIPETVEAFARAVASA